MSANAVLSRELTVRVFIGNELVNLPPDTQVTVLSSLCGWRAHLREGWNQLGEPTFVAEITDFLDAASPEPQAKDSLEWNTYRLQRTGGKRPELTDEQFTVWAKEVLKSG